MEFFLGNSINGIEHEIENIADIELLESNDYCENYYLGEIIFFIY